MGRAGGLELRQLNQNEQPAGSLDQRTHRAGVGRALDEVTLPVPGELPVFHLRRANMDAHHVGYLALSILSFASGNAFVAGVAQAGD